MAASMRIKDRRVEEFKPSSWWEEDSNCHYLLVDLPDFEKEDIKIQIDSINHVTIRGERRKKDNKYIYFEETVKVPENTDIEETSAIIEDGLLTVRLPKRTTTWVEKEKTEHHEQDFNKKPPESEVRERKSSKDRFYNEKIIKKGGEETSIFRSAMKILNRNKVIILIAVLAFSLGVWVSSKLSGHEKALE